MDRRIYFRRRHRHARDREVDPVKTRGIIGERRISAGATSSDDGAHDGVDVFGNFPFRREEAAKSRSKLVSR